MKKKEDPMHDHGARQMQPTPTPRPPVPEHQVPRLGDPDRHLRSPWVAKIGKGPDELWVLRKGVWIDGLGRRAEFEVLGRRLRRGRYAWKLHENFHVYFGSDRRVVTSRLAGLPPLAAGFLKWFAFELGMQLLTAEEVERRTSPSSFSLKSIADHEYVLRKTPIRGELSIEASEAEIYRLTGEELPYLWEEGKYQAWLLEREMSSSSARASA